MSVKTGIMVDSTIGKLSIDTAGSHIAGVKMDSAQAYADVPELLQSYINESNMAAWDKIKERRG